MHHWFEETQAKQYAKYIITSPFVRFEVNVKGEFSAGYLIFALMFTFGVIP